MPSRVNYQIPTGGKHMFARFAAIALATLVGSAVVMTAPSDAAQTQPKTPSAALAAARRFAACPDCRYGYVPFPPGKSAATTANRGVIAISVTDPPPGGGGYIMVMGHSGTSWKPLWEGNGEFRGGYYLPGKIAICMRAGGWTNLRSGPGTRYRAIAKITKPIVTRAYEMRLTKKMDASGEGQAWYRIKLDGQTAWVQNKRIVGTDDWQAEVSTKDCQERWGWFD